MDNAAYLDAVTKRSKEIFDWAGHRVREMVTMKYPADTHILDIGAGQGKYRILLPEYEAVDAVEVFELYVERNNLRELYRHVYVCDVIRFVESSAFPARVADAVIIMGDVLEHLSLEHAQFVLECFRAYATEVIVVVPYEYPQGEEDGNVHQEHLQDNLTVESMTRDYPELTLMEVEVRDDKPFKGIYRWRR